MANMEKIIRPHLPPNTAPTDTTSRCQVPPENKVLSFGKSPSTNSRSVTTQYSESYSMSQNWYMTKQEQETETPPQ